MTLDEMIAREIAKLSKPQMARRDAQALADATADHDGRCGCNKCETLANWMVDRDARIVWSGVPTINALINGEGT